MRLFLNRRIKINKTKNKQSKKARQACTKDNSGEDFPEFFIDGGELKSGSVQDIDGCL